MNLILKARDFAREAHDSIGQKRKYSNQPYWVHPYRVAARVLQRNEANEAMVAAAFLHDTIEDVPNVTPYIIEREFGSEVARMVVGLTQYSKQIKSTESREKRKVMDLAYLDKQLDDVKIIKLEDRFDNIFDIKINDRGFYDKVYRNETLDLIHIIGYVDEVLKQRIAHICK